MSMEQKNRSASKYAVEFRSMMVKAGMVDGGDGDVLIDMFYKGLRDDVKDEAIKLNRDTSLENYMSQAIRIDNRLFERRQEKKGNYALGGNKPNQGKKRNNPSTASGTHSGPVELGGVNIRKGKLRCYNCGKFGSHVARDCKGQKRERNEWEPIFTPGNKGNNFRTFGIIRIR